MGICVAGEEGIEGTVAEGKYDAAVVEINRRRRNTQHGITQGHPLRLCKGWPLGNRMHFGNLIACGPEDGESGGSHLHRFAGRHKPLFDLPAVNDVHKRFVPIGRVGYVAPHHIIRAVAVQNRYQPLKMIFLRMGEEDEINMPVPKRHVATEAIENGIIGSAVHQHIPSVGETNIGGVSLAYITKYYMQFSIRK